MKAGRREDVASTETGFLLFGLSHEAEPSWLQSQVSCLLPRGDLVAVGGKMFL